MKLEPIKYNYRTQVRWTTECKGILNCKDKPDVSVACAPEDLFVGAIEVCTMTTFLWLANKKKINIKSYKSEATGTAQMSEGALRFTSINIKIKIGISTKEDKSKVKRIIPEIEKWCLVSKSIKPEVKIEPEIFIA